MKTLILGFDSFDPNVFEELAGRNQLPNLEKFSQGGRYSKLEVSSPPQTEVSWTSIATGVDPGGHGIFDFVHRDPATYMPYVSILPMRKSAVGEQFVLLIQQPHFLKRLRIWVIQRLRCGGRPCSRPGLSYRS